MPEKLYRYSAVKSGTAIDESRGWRRGPVARGNFKTSFIYGLFGVKCFAIFGPQTEQIRILGDASIGLLPEDLRICSCFENFFNACAREKDGAKYQAQKLNSKSPPNGHNRYSSEKLSVDTIHRHQIIASDRNIQSTRQFHKNVKLILTSQKRLVIARASRYPEQISKMFDARVVRQRAILTLTRIGNFQCPYDALF